MSELIPTGKSAPDFSLSDQQGQTHRLRQYRGQWVVLYFYPKDNTPGCTKQAQMFRDTLSQLEDRGAVVLGVSPDNVASHQRFAQKCSLSFPLLADTDQKVCMRYGVWQQKSLYGRKFMGVVRTTYLIDPTGKIAHRWDKVKVADHIQDVLSVLDAHAR